MLKEIINDDNWKFSKLAQTKKSMRSANRHVFPCVMT